eukprot:m.677210 g.677210  ORF g.677210 m.677210 type:complete len:198 (-) comp22794_c0_seq16:212-805(-)
MSPSQVWIGSSLLGRDCHGTYMRYEAIPDISNFENQFSDLHTVQDVADRYAEDPGFFDQLRSPTECYMAPDVESGVIYRDQQDCVVWQVSKDDGKVRTDDGLTVASSIAEFFLRVFIENKIWFKTNESRFARDSAGRLFKDNSDWDAVDVSFWGLLFRLQPRSNSAPLGSSSGVTFFQKRSVLVRVRGSPTRTCTSV